MPGRQAPKNGTEPQWPADKVERWGLDRLAPYARNARLHSEEQVDQIAASIREWGWTNPVLVDEAGEIIAGHGRVLAAEKLGLPAAPVMVAVGWSDEQKRAYRIADNKLPENARWDFPALRLELADLAELGFNVPLIGFAVEDLAAFFASRPGVSVDDPLGEWRGMPDYNHSDKSAFRSIVIHFPDQAAVDRFARLVAQTITDKTRFLWFPKAEIETYVDKHYSAREPAVPDLHPK